MQLKDILKEKRRGKVTKGVLFLHDNAPAHPAEEPGLPGFPMSLSPTLFSGYGPVGLPPVPWIEKKKLNGRHFSSDMEVIAATETWLDGQLSEFFLSGLQKLEQRVKKCIELCGE